ncbi:pili assembly chaperone protein SafB [Izhakiella australiensis]|uniref:Pili assembly chaperone protein SafB n=1 Tax=Izhakiella australiensis TaxID=1926881 RepID=A0A1S8YKA2_9GAMM|nr:fimbria/pilus periplasmic chaperone [Izhakiella australiensis]OON39440.1 pili assembly chaperone protein SafB [Izhakiella australiensis]
MKFISTVAMTAALFALSAGSLVKAADQNITTNTNSFSVKLGATRVIYPENSDGATLSLANPQSYPILVQSSVVAADKKSPAPFIVTPPLFRLEANQQSRIRVVSTGANLPADRETLQWLCVKGVPPQQAGNNASHSTDTQINLQLSINTCDKLFFRPASVKGGPDDVANQLTWRRQNGALQVTNPTPFYISFASVHIGGKALSGVEMVAPYSSATVPFSATASGEVEWQVITDLGGESRTFRAALK